MAPENAHALSRDNPQKIPLPVYMIGLSILWSFIVDISLLLSISGTHKYAEDYTLIQARTAFEGDVLYRHWNDDIGGGFVVASNNIPPYYHLLGDDLKVVETTGGLQLTKVNADCMIRLVHEMDSMKDGVRMHLTSNVPIREKNKVDAWEAKALDTLEKDKKPEWPSWSISTAKNTCVS